MVLRELSQRRHSEGLVALVCCVLTPSGTVPKASNFDRRGTFTDRLFIGHCLDESRRNLANQTLPPTTMETHRRSILGLVSTAILILGTTACGGQAREVDGDGDGLVDSSESALKTDPNDPDTDDDGVSDGDEVDDEADEHDSADEADDGMGSEDSEADEVAEAAEAEEPEADEAEETEMEDAAEL